MMNVTIVIDVPMMQNQMNMINGPPSMIISRTLWGAGASAAASSPSARPVPEARQRMVRKRTSGR